MGWPAATISLAVAINIALFGLLGPFAAALMQSIGVRRTLLLGLGIVALSTAATSFIQTPLQLVLTWGVGVGLGVGAIGLVVAATVSTRWFVKSRGLVVGLLTGANATGQLVSCRHRCARRPFRLAAARTDPRRRRAARRDPGGAVHARPAGIDRLARLRRRAGGAG